MSANKQSVEEALIQKSLKITIQIPYKKVYLMFFPKQKKF